MAEFSARGYLMIVAVADTHTVIWYLMNDKRLGTNAKNTIEKASQQGNKIAISAITLVEIVYLVERHRIATESFSALMSVLDEGNSVLVEVALSPNIVRVMTQIDWNQVPDMPDRIIVATAYHLDVPLLSRDHKIQASDIQTIW